MSDHHSTRNSGMSNNNNNNETPLQNRKLSLTTDEQNKPIPAISRELEKISVGTQNKYFKVCTDLNIDKWKRIYHLKRDWKR